MVMLIDFLDRWLVVPCLRREETELDRQARTAIAWSTIVLIPMFLSLSILGGLYMVDNTPEPLWANLAFLHIFFLIFCVISYCLNRFTSVPPSGLAFVVFIVTMFHFAFSSFALKNNYVAIQSLSVFALYAYICIPPTLTLVSVGAAATIIVLTTFASVSFAIDESISIIGIASNPAMIPGRLIISVIIPACSLLGLYVMFRRGEGLRERVEVLRVVAQKVSASLSMYQLEECREILEDFTEWLDSDLLIQYNALIDVLGLYRSFLPPRVMEEFMREARSNALRGGTRSGNLTHETPLPRAIKKSGKDEAGNTRRVKISEARELIKGRKMLLDRGSKQTESTVASNQESITLVTLGDISDTEGEQIETSSRDETATATATTVTLYDLTGGPLTSSRVHSGMCSVAYLRVRPRKPVEAVDASATCAMLNAIESALAGISAACERTGGFVHEMRNDRVLVSWSVGRRVLNAPERACDFIWELLRSGFFQKHSVDCACSHGNVFYGTVGGSSHKSLLLHIPWMDSLELLLRGSELHHLPLLSENIVNSVHGIFIFRAVDVFRISGSPSSCKAFKLSRKLLPDFRALDTKGHESQPEETEWMYTFASADDNPDEVVTEAIHKLSLGNYEGAASLLDKLPNSFRTDFSLSSVEQHAAKCQACGQPTYYRELGYALHRAPQEAKPKTKTASSSRFVRSLKK